MHEGDEPDALADLRDADVLAGEGVTEIHLVPLKQIPPQCVTTLPNTVRQRPQ